MLATTAVRNHGNIADIFVSAFLPISVSRKYCHVGVVRGGWVAARGTGVAVGEAKVTDGGRVDPPPTPAGAWGVGE